MPSYKQGGISQEGKLDTPDRERGLNSRQVLLPHTCYRCDSAETPDITSDDEKDSCLSCTGLRAVKDDKCVLVQ